MRMERDRLWQLAVPRLTQFCAHHSLTFLLVDLPSDLHHLLHHSASSSSSVAAADWVSALRSGEIARCRDQSIGPDFVVSATVFHIGPKYMQTHCLQCFDAVGWAEGRASSL